MTPPRLEVAEIFRRHGDAFLNRYGETLRPEQRRALSDIAACRTAALGGHVEECDRCGHRQIAYNSCRNRHCPKCQATAAARWVEAREAELLPVEYAHVVFTLPAVLGPIALPNPREVYNILFRAAAETLQQSAAHPNHLGAEIGFVAVLHTWGQNLEHHPHLHCVVPGGGLTPDGERWIACQNGFFLPVRVLSRLFRRLFLQGLEAMHAADELQFFADLSKLKHANAWRAYLPPLRKSEWVVYAKKPFAGPLQVLAYLARYTHRVAISNSRLLDLDATHVSFRWKDYRENGRHRSKLMHLDAGEFMRRFLLHVLPTGFHRIRHYGLLAKTSGADNIARARELLAGPKPQSQPADRDATDHNQPACPWCGGRMIIIETFPRGATPRHQPTDPIIRTTLD